MLKCVAVQLKTFEHKHCCMLLLGLGDIIINFFHSQLLFFSIHVWLL